jgi:predicted nucleic acid-binding protein
LTCTANVLISSDEDLLTLNPYQHIPVILPKDYLIGF